MTAYRIFLWGSKIAPLLPVWLGNTLCDLAGLLFYLFVPAKRRAVMGNLSHVLPDRSIPERRRVARGIFRNVVRNYYDLLRVHKLPQAEVNKLVDVYGLKECKTWLAEKGYSGAIVYAAHTGSFSLGAQVASHNDIDFYLLVEAIKPPELLELVRKLREKDPRTRTISIGGSEIRQIFRLVKQKDAYICLAIDRDVNGNGEPVTFFGAETCLPTGAAEIALRTKTPVIPVHSYKHDGRYVIQFHPELAFVPQPSEDKTGDARRVTEQMLANLEKLIRLTPDQWVVLQPNWPDCG